MCLFVNILHKQSIFTTPKLANRHVLVTKAKTHTEDVLLIIKILSKARIIYDNCIYNNGMAFSTQLDLLHVLNELIVPGNPRFYLQPYANKLCLLSVQPHGTSCHMHFGFLRLLRTIFLTTISIIL